MDDVQIITQDGKPAFAVVPYDTWLELTSSRAKESSIPNQVLDLKARHKCSLIAAWRRYKGLSQKGLAEKLGIGQSALSQIEKVGNKVQIDTIQKVAKALSIDVEQLHEI